MKYDDRLEEFVERKKMGRPPVYETGITLDRIAEVYQVEKSTRRTAEILGIADNTARKYIRLLKQNRPSGRNPDPNSWTARSLSPVAKWVMAQTEPLPHNIQKLVQMSGLSQDQFYYYFKRRVRAAKAYLESLGDLREQEKLVLVDIKGRRIPAPMLLNYEIKVDKFSLLVEIKGVLKFGGQTIFRLSFPKYVELF